MTMPSRSLVPHLTAIGSGKGGTGKTFIAVNLAHALAHEGERVLLCDADLGLSNTGIHLGLEHRGDLPALLAGSKSLRDCVTRAQAGPRAWFDLLAAPSGALVDCGESAIGRLIAALRCAKHYDRVLIDLGAGIDNGVMTFAAHADETLLVLTADPTSLTDAYAFAKTLQRRTAGCTPSLVVNMAANAGEARRTSEALIASSRAFLKTVPDYLGFVPSDAKVVDCIRRQTPLASLYPGCAAALAIETLARVLHKRTNPPKITLAAVR